MNRYGDSAALRQALLKRLANQAADLGLPSERLQRRATFERLLVRLEHARPGRFVLKGGMALDVRLGARARRTRDLDLVVRDEIADGTALREIVIECLLDDPDGDGFEFLVGAPREIRADEAGRPGWGLPVDARLAGTTFARVKVEIVDRADEITGVQRIGLPGVLAFAGMPVADVEAVDFAQHFAEKLHAYTRRYGDRENSRAKDLVDMAILIEERVDPGAALAAARHVFAVRELHVLPSELPDPPAFWREDYARLVQDLDVAARTVDDAMTVVRAFWAQALATEAGD